MFDVQHWLDRVEKEGQVDFKEEDFDHGEDELIEEVNHNGILNNVHYEVSTGFVQRLDEDSAPIRIKIV